MATIAALPFAAQCLQADAAQGLEYAITQAKLALEPRHIVWRWASNGAFSWIEILLQARLAFWGNTRPPIPYLALHFFQKRPELPTLRRTPLHIPDELRVWQAPCLKLPTSPTVVARSALLGKAGFVWAVEDDFRERGEQPSDPPTHPHAASGLATVFGLPIGDSTRVLWTTVVPQLAQHVQATSKVHPAKPYALYHGTGGDVRWLLRGDALRPSPVGMFGRGVYLGSFWKSTRYAGFQRAGAGGEFTLRPDSAMVARVLVFASPLSMKAPAVLGAGAPPAAVEALRRKCCDNGGQWRTRANAVMLAPTKLGVSRWLVRNEEWVAKADVCVVRHVAALNLLTVPRAPWQPWARFACIH